MEGDGYRQNIDWSTVEDATARRIPKLVRSALRGDYAAALRLLGLCLLAAERNKTAHPRLRVYARKMGRNLHTSDDPVNALCLKRPASRSPDPEIALVHEWAAYRVAGLRAQGIYVNDAVEQVVGEWEMIMQKDDGFDVEEEGFSAHTVRAAYYEYYKNQPEFKQWKAALKGQKEQAVWNKLFKRATELRPGVWRISKKLFSKLFPPKKFPPDSF